MPLFTCYVCKIGTWLLPGKPYRIAYVGWFIFIFLVILRWASKAGQTGPLHKVTPFHTFVSCPVLENYGIDCGVWLCWVNGTDRANDIGHLWLHHYVTWILSPILLECFFSFSFKFHRSKLPCLGCLCQRAMYPVYWKSMTWSQRHPEQGRKWVSQQHRNRLSDSMDELRRSCFLVQPHMWS